MFISIWCTCAAAATKIKCHPCFPEEELHHVFNAADFGVFYENTQNFGKVRAQMVPVR